MEEVEEESSFVNNVTCANRTQQFETIRYFTYGIILPAICSFGIIGNLLNLVVLNQKNYRKGSAYIYMRGYSAASLFAIIVAIPFGLRIHIHTGSAWGNYYQAFFHTYLELYLGNSSLGVGVLMLVALTMERYFAVVHPEKSRSQKSYLVVTLLTLSTMTIYSPHLFRSKLKECYRDGILLYEQTENSEYLQSTVYRIYTWFLAITYRLGPTILLVYLNLRIIIAYRRTCSNRRRMTGKVSRDDKRKYLEESRIMFLLGSTSALFFICVTPMVILSITMTKALLHSFSFQVFRAVANSLEVTNYSMTFYIYCLFSREFRLTFFGLFKSSEKRVGGTVRLSGGRKDGGRSSTPLTVGGSTPLL